jgi:ABC-type phosphate transport system auxiliary subunit
MAKIIDLDFLMPENRDPVVGRVKIGDAEYDLRKVDLVEDWLILLGSIDEFIRLAEGGETTPESASGALVLLKSRLRVLIRRLVPDVADDELERRFPRVDDLRRVFALLVQEMRGLAPEALKKD